MSSAKSVEFFFDVGSPASYLAWAQLPALCEQRRASLIYRPMLLGGVFQATGNASPGAVPAKGRYSWLDFQRHARRASLPLTRNPHLPIITLYLMRAITGVQLRLPQSFDAFLATVFRAIWVDALNLNDPQVVAATLKAGGFDPADIDRLANDPEVKAALRATTDDAIARGVFGAPTFFVGDDMYFGQDRLDFVREALTTENAHG